MKASVKVVQKPWGHEIWYAHAPAYAGKILFLKKGHRLSLQYHVKKSETVYVLKGNLALELAGRKHKVGAGRSFDIFPKMVHRFAAPYGPVTLLEVSSPELWDVVRLSDDYGRLQANGSRPPRAAGRKPRARSPRRL